MADITQDTVDTAKVGGGPFGTQMSKLTQRGEDLAAKSVATQTKMDQTNTATEETLKAKAAAMAPGQAELVKKSGEAPETPKLEQVPGYEKPQMKPEDYKESFFMLMAASLMVGASSRSPYNSMMTAMTGAMDGFQKRDDEMVKQSMQVFDKNLASVKERNSAMRAEFEDNWKKHKNDLDTLRLNNEMIAAKYDQEITVQAVRSKSLTDQQKFIEQQIGQNNQLETRLTQMQQHAEEMQQRRADSAQRHADTTSSNFSAKYKSDPEYKKQVDAWAHVVASGGSIPARFAQTVGKEMSHDVYLAAPQFAGGGENSIMANQIAAREIKAQAQKIGTQSASVAIAGKELERFIPLAEAAIDKVPRSGWKPINELIRAGANTWSPEQGQLVIANRAVQTAYAQLINRGAPTVHSSEEAEKMLNDADSPAVYKAKTKQLLAEVKQAEAGLADTHKELMDRVNKMGLPDEPKPSSPAAPGNAAPYSDPDKEARYQAWKAANGK